ncbi:hypothetical protein BXT86_04435 [candidate division WOR-3 bacterium 4484_100]|uniref:Bacterial sugar transferase domain-containing protein n=1 Tax=candidate division WOR-3 bacterium 4484_100 TaxID=1936077 RepID=A0A1V4QG38_UNCW3|nr:MAG: hypothetical protein BXT86_04435 [candidate division WOR-3 bacterium 4484_100]
MMKGILRKRIFDIVLSAGGLLLSAWLWAFIIILIIIEDGFPFLIKQQRVGQNGRLFKSYKFRSMRKSTLTEEINIQARPDDPRVTRVGRFLRKTALDELPQLINILLGDMSFVGPRPLLPNEIEVYANGGTVNITDIPGYKERITMSPGLTGISQIFADRDLPRYLKFKYDIQYLQKYSIFFDIKLILLSFIITFCKSWEKRGMKIGLLKNFRIKSENL